MQNVLCGDNLDSNPKCYIEGEYDLNTIGKYPLVFKAEDKYGNISTKNFTLNVYKPSNSSSSSKTPTYKNYADIVSEYKNENTFNINQKEIEENNKKLNNELKNCEFIRMAGLS